ncbi:hypothetical protein ACQY0O_006173 [Thecaphora frezii]
MPGLLSLRRPGHPAAVDADQAQSQSQQQSQTHGQGTLGRWIRGGGGASNAQNDVEMNAANVNAANDGLEPNDAQPASSHDRQASGRSILSNISLPSLASLRQRDRDAEMLRQIQRAEANRPPSPAQLESGAALYAGATNPHAAAAASVGAGPPVETAPSTTSPLRPPPTKKSSAKSRREREEAAMLFGPNLANYFGSGNSSSGAVTATAQTAAAASTAQPPASPDPASSGALPVQARQARLGSRGRARGASLSGLSMMSLGAESVTSLGGLHAPTTETAAAGTMDGSTYDLINQLSRSGKVDAGEVAMSEGIDIETLQRWVEKSAGSDPGSLPGVSSSATIPPVCTTLQSYVNIKRNAARLAIRPPEEAAASTALSASSTPTLGLAPSGFEHSRSTSASTDTNLLRSSPSLSLLPSLSPAVTGKNPAAALPDTTHTIYFEYDCAAPCASVQIFIRASRKHGSWVNFVPPPEGLPDVVDGAPAMLAQRGPPPHVLGWPVHVARLKKGFGVGHKAALCLDLKYYAPPSVAKAPAAEDKDADKNEGVQAKGKPAAREDPIPETPAWDVQRRLEIEREDAEEDAAAAAAERARRAGRPQGSTGTEAAAAPAVAASTDAVAETKEQRLAREKAERETLKVAIVVEALDANARPLREPNLQTTYLRLNSLPVRKPAGDAGDQSQPPPPADADSQPKRTWTAQVEGQEAEIGPHRFQLQELYGLSSKPPPVRPAPANAEDGEDDEERADGADGTNNTLNAMMDDSTGTECLICLSAPPTTLLLPCTHGLCLECAVQLRESVMGIRQSERRRGRVPKRKYACPVCRRGFTSMLHLSRANEKLVAQSSTLLA